MRKPKEVGPLPDDNDGDQEPEQGASVIVEVDGKAIASASVPVIAPTAKPKGRLDYAPKGGRYLVNGNLVDANGDPVKDSD